MNERVQTPAPRPAARVTVARAPRLARKCACAPGDPHCAKCESEEKRGAVQRKAAHGGALHGIPPIVHRAIGSPGRSLDHDTRAFMESRFGYDFSDVRIHTGAEAAEAARAVGAHAYTIGGDIVFDSGKYDPQSSMGRQLLAHELTHTIQQSGLSSTSLESLETTTPGDASEREAEEMAQTLLSVPSGVKTTVSAPHQVQLARLAAPKPVSNPNALKKLKNAGIKEVEAAEEMVDGQKRVLRRFEVKQLELPPEKGPQRAEQVFIDRAKAKALESIVSSAGQFRAVLKAERSAPGDLRKMWLTTVGLPVPEDDAQKAAVTKAWNDAGGKTIDFIDSATTQAGDLCQVDHIIELHIGGIDAPPNMQMLTGTLNNSSQAQIRAVITGHAKVVRDALGDAGIPIDEIAIRFKVAKQTAGVSEDDCSRIEDKVRAKMKSEQAAAKLAEGTEEYPLSAGGFASKILVKTKRKDETIIESSDLPVNAQAAGLVAGMRLVKLSRKTTKHFIEAKLDTDEGSKTRLPVTVKEATNKVKLDVTAGEIKLPKDAKPNIKFTFPYLSEGTITKLELTPEGLHASGSLTPSIPLLAGVKLGIDITPTSMSASLAPKTPLESPIPRLQLVDPQLTFMLYPDFKPEGSVGFYVGSKAKPLLDGVLKIGVEGTDFVGTGAVNVHLPGLKETTGTVNYSKSKGWSGDIHVATGEKSFIKEASVDVRMTDKGIDAEGSILAKPPGGSEVKLDIKREDGGLIYKGRGKIVIPKLIEATLDIEYGPRGFAINGTAPFELFKQKGKMTVGYKDEAFFGAVTDFKFSKGRANVILHELKYAKGKFSGNGEIEMPLGSLFTANGKVALNEQEQLSILATLKIAKPIPLFGPFTGSHTFFKVDIPIPIPGASIAGYGLVAHIGGSLEAGYTIGRAMLEEAELAAGVDPLQEGGGPSVSLKARLVMPASASITGTIKGEVELDVFVAEAAGGLKLTATATLNATSSAKIDVLYTPQRFSFDGELKAALELLIKIALEAYVRAKIGVSILSTSTEKKWKLGEWTFRPGASLTMNAKFHYDSDKDFQMPTITFGDPEIDAKRFVAGGFDNADESPEKEV